MSLKIDFKFQCIFDRRFDDFWIELGSHLAPKSRQNGAGWCGMLAFFLVPAAHVAPSCHLDPFWTNFSSIWAPFWLSAAHFFLILCPFWLQNSSEIVTTRLSERRTQIYGNAEIKIKKDMKILAPTFFQIARFLSLRPLTIDPATKRRGPKRGGGGDSPHGDFNNEFLTNFNEKYYLFNKI